MSKQPKEPYNVDFAAKAEPVPYEWHMNEARKKRATAASGRAHRLKKLERELAERRKEQGK